MLSFNLSKPIRGPAVVSVLFYNKSKCEEVMLVLSATRSIVKRKVNDDPNAYDIKFGNFSLQITGGHREEFETVEAERPQVLFPGKDQDEGEHGIARWNETMNLQPYFIRDGKIYAARDKQLNGSTVSAFFFKDKHARMTKFHHEDPTTGVWRPTTVSPTDVTRDESQRRIAFGDLPWYAKAAVTLILIFLIVLIVLIGASALGRLPFSSVFCPPPASDTTCRKYRRFRLLF